MTKPHGRPLPSEIFAGPAPLQSAPTPIDAPKQRPTPIPMPEIVERLQQTTLDPTMASLMRELFHKDQLLGEAAIKIAQMAPAEQTAEILQAKVVNLQGEIAALKEQLKTEQTALSIAGGKAS